MTREGRPAARRRVGGADAHQRQHLGRFGSDGGGEVDVTATVFGPSNEPVVSAPVEFFATNGSFAPVGPLLTDGDGKATTRLATNAATQVRARVLTIDSPTIEIGIKALGGGGQDGLPFHMSELVFLHAPDAADWDVTSEIFDVTFDPQGTSRRHPNLFSALQGRQVEAFRRG